MMVAGPIGSMACSPRPSLPTIWPAKRRSAQRRNKSSQETRREFRTKTRKGVGTTNYRRAMIGPRPTSRAEREPYIPHLVRMLSPLPDSDAFKDVCAAEVSYTVRGEAVGGHYPRDLPDMKTLLQTIARNVCALLYKSPAEVPAGENPSTAPWQYARKLDVISEDGLRGASVSCDYSHCKPSIAPAL